MSNGTNTRRIDHEGTRQPSVIRFPYLTPAAKRLDQHLAQAIQQINSSRGDRRMPEIGGKSLAESVRLGLAGLKKELDALKLDAAASLTELSTEIKNGQEGVKRIREETAAVKDAFADILGNEHVSSEQK